MLLVALALVCGPVVAQESLGEPNGLPRAGEDLARATGELTALMRCPVCQGLSVAASTTPSARAMKAKAEELLALGYDEEQVLTHFESAYGEFIRLTPRAEGFNLTVWILPVMVLCLGGVLIWRRLAPGGGRLTAGGAGRKDSDLEIYLERVRREVAE